MTILDAHGRPLRRTIGFLSRYEPVQAAKPLVGSLVGIDVPVEPDEEEEDARQEQEQRVVIG